MFFKWRNDDKNWAYFYKIKGFKNRSYQKNKNKTKKICSPNPIILQETHFLKFLTKKIIWKIQI